MSTPYDPTRKHGTNDLSRADIEADSRRRLDDLGRRLEAAMLKALTRDDVTPRETEDR